MRGTGLVILDVGKEVRESLTLRIFEVGIEVTSTVLVN